MVGGIVPDVIVEMYRLRMRNKKILESMGSCFSGYCQYSNLHGFRNIAGANTKWQESLFWILVCGSGVLMTILMFCSVWERFQISPTITTIETNNFPVKNVPFPAVTFCNLNKVLRSSFEVMAKKFEKHGVNESVLETYLREILHIYITRKKTFEQEEIIRTAMNELGYDIESFMFDLSQPCSKYLIRCFWLGKNYNCSSLFDEVKTSEGFCCTFNWRREKKKFYPDVKIRKLWKKEKSFFESDSGYLFVNDASTPLSGLTVVVDPDEDNYFGAVDSFFGSVIVLHESHQYPDVDSPKAFIQPKSQAMVRLRPSVIESSKNVKHLKIHQRQCYFDGEFSVETGSRYSYEACSLECKLYTYYRKCGCIPFYYPNVTKSRKCYLSDMKCILENRVLAGHDTETADEEWDTVKPGYHCRCLPSCNDVNYDWSIQVNDIRNPDYASPIFEKKLGNRSAISVFFEQNVCIKYRVESLITWDSVIASFGGIFGLCLGGSIISLIELLYYFVYDYGKSYRKEIKSETRRNKIGWIKVNHRIANRSRWDLQHSLYNNGILPWMEGIVPVNF